MPVSVVKGATTLPKTTMQISETLVSFWIMKLMNESTFVKVLVKKGLEKDSLVQILKPNLNSTEKKYY